MSDRRLVVIAVDMEAGAEAPYSDPSEWDWTNLVGEGTEYFGQASLPDSAGREHYEVLINRKDTT